MEEDIDEIENISGLIGQYTVNYLCKKPCRTSEQIGYLWVQEILCGHSIRCYKMFRMEKHIFFQFCDELVEQGLKCTRQMEVQKMVAMFLNTVSHGVGNRIIQKRFQHSGETLSRHFHELDQVINPNLLEKKKGYPTQNIMVICDWEMCFIFALPGWEGTVHDARVFDNAITTPTMNFPHPPSDASYPTPKGYIGPYKCERYHLADFRHSSGFTNHNEVFNYYHSSLRCTIERTFGAWKNRFSILRHMPKFKIETQVQIVCATMAIHNFIRRHSETDTEFNQYEHANILDGEDNSYVGESSYQTLTISFSAEMDHVRDSIRDQIINHMQ
ncbi:hypothetical protein AAHE18_20G154400 [Arachis hypogaea]